MKPRATKITQELQYWPFFCRSSSDDISRKGHIYTWERREVKRSWKLCRNSCYVFKKLQLGFRIKGFFLFSCTLKFPTFQYWLKMKQLLVARWYVDVQSGEAVSELKCVSTQYGFCCTYCYPWEAQKFTFLSRLSRKAYTV